MPAVFTVFKLFLVPVRSFHIKYTLRYCQAIQISNEEDSIITMKVLNVAEKNDAAKNISQYLSGGNSRRREGLSKFNKIYEFDYNVRGQNSQMVMTSVSGHMLQLDFTGAYKSWRGCNPLALFDAPVQKFCPDNYQQIKRTIEREIRSCQMLIIWTDCDREGENIGFEIIDTCRAVKPNIQVFRAKFSEITAPSVRRAVQQLEAPNKFLSDAVDVRSELDLRIGAAFTRFQTLRLQQVFPERLANQLISYGSCQFPTLGFVVERYKAVKNFIPEPFWKISVNHTLEEVSVDFSWKRVRLFNELACTVLLEFVLEQPTATVEKVTSKPKSKWRPLPLDTIELEKLGSRKLKINAKETMRVAERLYTQGFISYPRTETNIFPKELNLTNLVQMQVPNNQWGAFAQHIVEEGPNPRQGNKSDQAHPPIHPTKYADNLQGNEGRIYEFIVRHFLACCSKDAQGHETVVDIDINGEKFVASGLMIIARNYLDVYPYDKWNAKEIHQYQEGQTFQPTDIKMSDGETSAPRLLTEADLIALMEKHGIGTDATHAEHIETIKNRSYVGLDNIYFLPGELGLGLVDGYDSMGFPMSKPNLRAELEAGLKAICEGTRNPREVLSEQIARYKAVFEVALQQARKIDTALSEYLNEAGQPAADVEFLELQPKNVRPCPACGLDMVLRTKRDNTGFYLGCMGYPECRGSIWLPSTIENVDVSEESCAHCGPNTKKLKFQFKRHAYHPFYPDNYTGCVGGCDEHFLNSIGVLDQALGQRVTGRNAAVGSTSLGNRNGDDPDFPDSGFGSSISSTFSNRSWSSGTQGGRNGTSASNTSNTASRNVPVASGGDAPVQCYCHVEALRFTVRKEGPNQGRPFFKCGNNSSCDYFLWANEAGNPPARDNQRGRGNTAGGIRRGNTRVDGGSSIAGDFTVGDMGDEVMCGCGQAAKRLTVNKDGPNKGRPFFTCHKPRDQGCNFFKWGDKEEEEGGGGGGGGRGRGEFPSNWGSSGRGSSSWGRGGRGGGTSAAAGGTRAKRKCGNCGQEGHNRTKCPNN